MARDAAGVGGHTEQGRQGRLIVSAQTPGPPTRAAAFVQLREFLKHDVKNVDIQAADLDILRLEDVRETVPERLEQIR